MRKQIIIMLFIVMTLTLAACGGKSGPVEAGDTLKLGELDWLVLTVDNGMALLLSDKILETRAFDSSSNEWELSDIRAYLNGSFYDSTFSEKEKKQIAESKITTIWRVGETGKDQSITDDKVFLLSEEELEEYMGESATDDIRNAKAAVHIATESDSFWWLRTPASNREGRVLLVLGNGQHGWRGNSVDSEAIGIRPAMWIKL